jgi:indolepyruvate ferredoxin oxidoreductase
MKSKIRLGKWTTPFLKIMAACRFLRGTPLDVFGWHRHRRQERELIAWYTKLIEDVVGAANGSSMEQARAILEIPDQIRGYGEIKARSIAAAQAEAERLLDQLRAAAPLHTL